MKTAKTVKNVILRGMAKHTYNRVMSAMAEDHSLHMYCTFQTLPPLAKSIVHHSGHFSNSYVLGNRKDIPVEEAADELVDRTISCLTFKFRNIDIICAVAFLTEYILRRRLSLDSLIF